MARNIPYITKYALYSYITNPRTRTNTHEHARVHTHTRETPLPGIPGRGGPHRVQGVPHKSLEHFLFKRGEQKLAYPETEPTTPALPQSATACIT